MQARMQAAPAVAAATANEIWRPSMYASRMPGICSAGNTSRISDTPIAMSLTTSTSGAVTASDPSILLTKAHCAADKRIAPAMVSETVLGGKANHVSITEARRCVVNMILTYNDGRDDGEIFWLRLGLAMDDGKLEGKTKRKPRKKLAAHLLAEGRVKVESNHQPDGESRDGDTKGHDQNRVLNEVLDG